MSLGLTLKPPFSLLVECVYPKRMGGSNGPYDVLLLRQRQGQLTQVGQGASPSPITDPDPGESIDRIARRHVLGFRPSL